MTERKRPNIYDGQERKNPSYVNDRKRKVPHMCKERKEKNERKTPPNNSQNFQDKNKNHLVVKAKWIQNQIMESIVIKVQVNFKIKLL